MPSEVFLDLKQYEVLLTLLSFPEILQQSTNDEAASSTHDSAIHVTTFQRKRISRPEQSLAWETLRDKKTFRAGTAADGFFTLLAQFSLPILSKWTIAKCVARPCLAALRKRPSFLKGNTTSIQI